MTVTLVGYQGTVSDAAMAKMFPQVGSGTVDSAADLAVTAVAGNRQVSVSPGAATVPFQRYVSDAAQTLTLAPPTSGGKFYGIAVNRQWSPANTAVLEAVDLGIATDGTVPAGPTPATLPAALRNNPGTGSSSTPPAAGYGSHQLLALVHVRAADTALTIFDTRLIADVVGEVTAQSIMAVYWAGLFRTPKVGSVVAAADGITYRWMGTVWKAWDSGWFTTTAGWNNIGFQSDNTPQFRYHAGVVKVRVYSSNLISNANNGGVILLTLPVAFSAPGTSSLPVGRGLISNSAGLLVYLTVTVYDATHVQFAYLDATAPDREQLLRTNAPSPILAAGVNVETVFEYDAA